MQLPHHSTSLLLLIGLAAGMNAAEPDRVKTANGVIQGPGRQPSGVRMFRGIPYAAPPVGDLRWRQPQPVKNWDGVREAMQFAPRCMQHPIFGDMNFRSNGMSEDCLYLNVWTPAKSAKERLPVLVYFFGGGFVAGDGSEPRYDGESMATKGIVALTVNYRLGVFGFMAHPDLTKESPQHASGNYALLDQSAALRWVRDNIAAFGGDPKKVTIAGESAGSFAVSAQMASPLSKDLIAGAIGESGSVLGAFAAVPLEQAEKAGVKFAGSLKANSIAELRAMSTEQIHQVAKNAMGRFPITVDGYFFPKSPLETYTAGEQAHVPLLAGWNSEEMTGKALFGKQEPTVANYEKIVRGLYKDDADQVLKAYAAKSDADVMDVATALAGDRFIGFSTWKWADVCAHTGGKSVYRYLYARPRPAMVPEMGNATAGLAGGVVKNSDPNAKPAPPAKGAVHSAEIEYAMGNLSTNKVYAWTPDDYKVSREMQEYFANFVRKGDPNGKGLPKWPPTVADGTGPIMRIDVQSEAQPETHRDRYVLMDRLPAPRM